MQSSLNRLLAFLTLAVLALSTGTAEADVIYTAVDQTYSVSSSNTATSLSLVAGGSTFGYINGNYASFSPFPGTTINMAGFGISGPYLTPVANGGGPQDLSYGTTISGSTNFGTGNGTISSYGLGTSGNFAGVSDGYIGFKAVIGGQTDYGYIELKSVTGTSGGSPTASLEVVGYAYDNSSAGITAGEPATPAVPEPASLAMLASGLGMVAIRAIRRRRRAATA